MQTEIEAAFELGADALTPAHRELFEEFKSRLNSGALRSAEPDTTEPTGWRVNRWVKMGILLGFRLGILEQAGTLGYFSFFDKSTYPVKRFTLEDGVRLVPGGSAIRDGSYVAPGVTCMPPMYINVGAYVDEGTMIDSHALVGSCAQIGRRCHLSAGVQIGGVLEPVGALPVIIEDEVIIGGNCGVYEGTIVRRGAVLGTGTLLNRSTPVYDLVCERIYAADENQPLIIPENAVVVPGSRAVTRGKGIEWRLSLYTPVIVKYRDSKTDTRTQLEPWLR